MPLPEGTSGRLTVGGPISVPKRSETPRLPLEAFRRRHAVQSARAVYTRRAPSTDLRALVAPTFLDIILHTDRTVGGIKGEQVG